MRSDNGPPFASTGAGRLSLEEAVTPSAENLVEQRRAIDEWRRDYNDVRPHEALGDVPPALVFRRSPRGYPRKLLKPEPPAWREACDVDRYGCIPWRKHKLFVTRALTGEIVELERSSETTWQIRFLDLVIGSLDERKIDRRILMKRKPQPAEA